MRILKHNGECIQCGSTTNIQLDCGKFACVDCLNQIGQETRNVRGYLTTFAEIFDKEFMYNFFEMLNLMKYNNITSVDNIIKTLSAIQLYDEYQAGTINKENREKMQKQLDIFDFL